MADNDLIKNLEKISSEIRNRILKIQGKILKEKTGIMKLITDNGETLSILNPSYFVKMIEEWEKQKPKRKEKKRIYIPLH